MPRLTADHLHEVAEWMQRWQPSRQVVADAMRWRIVAGGGDGVLVFDAPAVARLVQADGDGGEA